MKAYVLHGIGDLRFEKKAVPEVGQSQVLVQVQAAGICGSDIPRIFHTGTYSFPMVPGHEFSGVVVKVGAQADKRWLGKRVGIFPLIPCGECIFCRHRTYELCRNYSYLGSRVDGGFAEYVAVPQKNLIALPDEVSYETAAMLEPAAVAAHAIRLARIEQQQTVVIYGLGTIGLLLAMLLKEMGINQVMVVGNKDQQRQFAAMLGITEENFCDIRTQKLDIWLRERTKGVGADVFFECVGKNDTIAEVIDLAAPMGMVLLVGNPYGEIKLDKAVYWKILRNQLTLKGSWNSSFTCEETDDWHYVLQRMAEKRIGPEKLITHLFPFGDLKQGLAVMQHKSEPYVKIMVKTVGAD